MDYLNIVCKWRSFFAGWHLGTKPNTDGPTRAIRNQYDLLIVTRVECSALARLLIEKKVFTAEEWTATVQDEARILADAYAEDYPGIRAFEDGLHMELPEAAETMKRLNFPA